MYVKNILLYSHKFLARQYYFINIFKKKKKKLKKTGKFKCSIKS
jgi:hypothetical protein